MLVGVLEARRADCVDLFTAHTNINVLLQGDFLWCCNTVAIHSSSFDYMHMSYCMRESKAPLEIEDVRKPISVWTFAVCYLSLPQQLPLSVYVGAR